MIRYEEILNAFRKIFCECEHCGQIFRLSETEIQVTGRQEADWLSKVESQLDRMSEQIDRAREMFELKRAKAVERERRLVERSTFRKINRLVPNFSKLKFNTRDIKTIGYPIKFVSFDGKDEGWVKKVRLIDYHPETSQQEKLLSSIEKTLKAGYVDWKTLRISDEGRVEEEPKQGRSNGKK